MMRQKLSIGLAAAAFTLSLAPVWAQERERPAQGESSRPSNGETVGSAVPRGGGSDGGSSASSSAGSATSSSSSGSSSSPGSSPTWMGSSPIHERAPVRPERMDREDRAEQRRGNGSGTTGRAVPRGESGGRTAGSAGSTSASSGSESEPSQGRSRAVPTYSRPRDGRNPVGTAVERTTPLLDRNGRRGYYYDPYNSFYYDPYYSGRYSYWSPFGYGYGLGYFSYDPFLFSGFGYPGYYGGGGLYDPYYGGYGGGGGYSSRYGEAYRGVGSLRLKVKPSNAQVYIDGYFVGVIDSYDGAFQRLSVEGGAHKVELRAEGFEPVQFDVMIAPGDTITYKGELKHK
jgi:hypothetical protein